MKRFNPDAFVAARKRARWTQNKVGQMIGRNHNWCSRVERGQRDITLNDYLACCELFGMSFEECLVVDSATEENHPL